MRELVIFNLLWMAALATVMRPPTVSMNAPHLVIKAYDQNFTIRCSGSGVNDPELTWYKDGTIVNSGGRMLIKDGVITVEKNWFNNIEGSYQCKSQNDYGTAQSNLVEIKQAFLNNFAAPPSTITPKAVNQGQPLKLDCLYTDPFSYPNAVWNWHVHDKLGQTNVQERSLSTNGRLSVDDRGNLYFQHVLPIDNQENWYYVCAAWNTVMNTKRYGSPHQVNVNPVANVPFSGPTLVYTNGEGSLKDRVLEVIEGEDVEMYCVFEGYPLVEVQWIKLGNTDKPLFQYENGRVRLVLKNVQNTEKYEGEYQCTGAQSGRSQRDSAKFRLSVLQRPRFIEGPVNTNVTEGGEVNFTCRASADPPASIEWYVNGEPVSNLQFDQRRTVSGNTYSMKQLRKGSNPQNTDLQVVSCMASNVKQQVEIGRAYKDGYVNVLLSMKFVVKPADLVLTKIDQTVVLNCSVSSDPSLTPVVSWHFDDSPIATTPDKYLIAPNNTLIVYTENFDQVEEVVGEYTCVAQTRNPDQTIKHSAKVTVDTGVIPVAAGINLWWIGLVLAILILILIIVLIYCCIKRSRQYDHDVDKLERKWGNDPEKDLQQFEFPEYGPKQRNPRMSTDRNGIALAEMENADDLTPVQADQGMTNVGYDYEPDQDSLNQYEQDINPGINPGYAPGPDDYGYSNTSYQPDV